MSTKDEVISKKDEALKLALEALEPLNYDRAFKDEIAAIREALAQSRSDDEQPAAIPQYITCPFCESQHVPGWLHDYNMDRMEQPAQQQEPEAVGEFEKAEYGDFPVLKWRPSYVAKIGDKLYTSPQPSKPWVYATTWRGLTDEEIEFIYADTGYNDIQMFSRAIEAKLKEKNGF